MELIMGKAYFILRLDSYTGDASSMICRAANNDYMFAVLLVADHQAEIIDYGYSSMTALLEAWGDVQFENLKNFE
jgi:hypothetical protein